ncbi:hypothetical protein KR009_003854 [Drosophila setifemur]|nr:hypothetical protein KR009_003854 [Drosophila setifemur]
MGLRSCARFAVLSMPLWTLAFYLLVVVPLPAQSASLEVGKEERRHQDLEPKVEDAYQSSANAAPLAFTRLGNRRSQRSFEFSHRVPLFSRPMIPIELDLLLDGDDDRTKSKRFDDYGHMRFGKRGGDDQSDDYGHMRFGR